MSHFLPLIVPAIILVFAFIDYKRVKRRSRKRAAAMKLLEAEAQAHYSFKKSRSTPNIAFDRSEP